MIQIKDIGKFESAPQIVSDIIDGDVNALEEELSKATGDYDHIHVVWNPKAKKIAAYDVEHEEL